MPDMREGLKKAGLSASPGAKAADPTRCPKCGGAKKPEYQVCYNCSKGGGHEYKFPDGYPVYFDEKGFTKREYVTDLAETIAEEFKNCRDPVQLTMHQLRAFYQYVKQREAALKKNVPEGKVLFEVAKLKSIANEREEKKRISTVFRQFIDRNVDKVTDKKSFVDGFVEHFQAVVAYSAGRLRDKEGQR